VSSQTYLVAPFDRNQDRPFPLDAAIAIEAANGAREAAALYAVDHLLPGTEAVVGVVPEGTRFPCAVATYSVFVEPRPTPLANPQLS
jgi:hypothetical protein